MYNNSIYNPSLNIERLSRQKDEIDNLIKTYQTMNAPQPINNFINTNNKEPLNSFRLNKLNDGDEVENIMITQDTIFIGTNRMQIKKLEGNDEDMHCLKKMLIKSLHELEEHNPDMYKEFEMKLYVLANGEVLTDEVKDEWVEHMEPKAKWTKAEVESVVNTRGIIIPVSSAYVIMNMLYSDFKDVLGSGDGETINNYVNAMKLWYYDVDAEHSEEHKLFKYYYNVVK